jgi:hypothetical protein
VNSAILSPFEWANKQVNTRQTFAKLLYVHHSCVL